MLFVSTGDVVELWLIALTCKSDRFVVTNASEHIACNISTNSPYCLRQGNKAYEVRESWDKVDGLSELADRSTEGFLT